MAMKDKSPAHPASAGYQGVPNSEPSEKFPRNVAQTASAVPVELKGPRKKFNKVVADTSSSYTSTVEFPGGGEAEPPGFDPMSINWTAAFLADDLELTDGDPVATWTDGSTNSWDLTGPPDSFNQPVYQSTLTTLGSQPAVVFDSGASQRLFTPQIPSMDTWTVVAVARLVSSTDDQNRPIFASTHDLSDSSPSGMVRSHLNSWQIYNTGIIDNGNPSNNDPALMVAKFGNTGDDSFYTNGSLMSLQPAATGVATGLVLSSYQNTYTSTEFAFAAIIPRELTAQEKYDLGAWAEEKYGITNGYTAP